MSGVIPIGISTLPRRCHQTMGSDTQPLIVGSSFRGGGGGNGQPLSVSGSGGASAYHGGALVGGSVIEARSYGSSTHRVDQTPGNNPFKFMPKILFKLFNRKYMWVTNFKFKFIPL